MVGRILRRLKARGVLREPLRNGVSTHKRLWQRPYAVRKPKGYQVLAPGDLIARLQVQGMKLEQSALSKIENGQRPVTDIEVVALAKALKVPAAWLLQVKS